MKILLTNDDGIDARGLAILHRVLSAKHRVSVIAPSHEKSGCSNAFTIRRDMTLHRHDENRFSLAGFPADCVNTGIHSGIIDDFALVVSGINHGPNLGDDTFFSGTVAGARTARIFGKPGIAISLDNHDPDDRRLEEAAGFLLSFIESLAINESAPFLLNINYPDIPENEIKGICMAPLSKRIYDDYYKISSEKNNTMTIRLEGNISAHYREGSDHDMLSRGYIAVTPLTIDNTDYQGMELPEEVQWRRKIST